MYFNSDNYTSSSLYATGLPLANLDLSDLSAQNVDLYIDRGDTYRKEFTLYDSVGAVLDLTGYDISFVLNRYEQDDAPIILSSIINNPTQGKVLLSASSSETALLKHSRYVFRISISNNSDVITLFRGQVLIS